MKSFRLILTSAILFAASVAVPAVAQTVFNHPQYVYGSCFGGDMKIRKVVLTDTATTVFFKKTCKDDVDIFLTPDCYIEDEEGNRYYIKGADGVAVQETDSMSVVTEVKGDVVSTTVRPYRVSSVTGRGFSLSFPPLPAATTMFDFHSGSALDCSHVYGIHDKSDASDLPTADESVSSEFLQQELAATGVAYVRGRITAGVDRMPRIWYLEFADELGWGWQAEERIPIMVHSDGTFEASLSLSHPCIASLKMGVINPARPVMLYLYPNDTINLTMSKADNGIFSCVYAHGTRCAKMLSHFPSTIYASQPVDEQKGLEENFASLREQEDAQLSLCDYLGTHYGFSPFENKLLKNEVRMSFLERRIGLVNKRLRRKADEAQKESSRNVEGRLSHIPYNQMEEFRLLREYIPTDEAFVCYSKGRRLMEECYYNSLLQAVYEEKERTYRQGTQMEECYGRSDSVLRLCLNYEQPSAFVECLLLRQALQYLIFHGTDANEPQYLTALSNRIKTPYLRNRLPALVGIDAGFNERELERMTAENIRETQGMDYTCSVLDSIAGRHKGKYVQIVSMTDSKGQLRFPQGLENLLIDFADSKDVAFVFVARGSLVSETDFEATRDFHYSGIRDREDCYRLSDEEWDKLSVLNGDIYGDVDHMTLNRKGKVLRQSLPLEETYFRRGLREILQEEAAGCGIRSRKYREAQAAVAEGQKN